jgi:hypothetical protein
MVGHHLPGAVRYPEIRRELATTAACCPAKVVILDCCFSGAAAGTFMSPAEQLAQRAAIEGAYLMTATAATAVALAPAGARHTAFTGAILDTVRTGIPHAPPVLDMATLFTDVETTLRRRHQPIPQSFGRDAGHRIAIVRNRQHTADQTPTPDRPTIGSGSGSRDDQGHPDHTADTGTRPPSTPAPPTPALSPPPPSTRTVRRRLLTGSALVVICLVLAATGAGYLGRYRQHAAPAPLASTASPDPSVPPGSSPSPGSSTGGSPPTPAASRRATPNPGRPGPATAGPVVPPATGTITSPADRTDVQSCAYFTGNATLPSGKTLILAKRNLTNGQPDRYVELVFDWDHPQPSWAWRGAQYFSTGNDADGQQFRIDLMAVDLTAAQAARTSNEINNLAATGLVLASRTVRRIPGTAPQDPCEGPPTP